MELFTFGKLSSFSGFRARILVVVLALATVSLADVFVLLRGLAAGAPSSNAEEESISLTVLALGLRPRFFRGG